MCLINADDNITIAWEKNEQQYIYSEILEWCHILNEQQSQFMRPNIIWSHLQYGGLRRMFASSLFFESHISIAASNCGSSISVSADVAA